MSTPDVAGASAPHVLRVTYSFSPSGVRLKSVQRVRMRAPAPPGPAPTGRTVGHWLAVEDAAGKVLYHFPLHDPVREDHEVYEHPGVGPTRAPSAKDHGTFEVLIPDIEGGVRLVIHGRHRGAPSIAFAAGAAAPPMAVHTLAELRQAARAGGGS